MKVMVVYLTQQKRPGRYQYRRRVPKELMIAVLRAAAQSTAENLLKTENLTEEIPITRS